MTYTFLRDNFYADFFVELPDEEGRILGPSGDGRVGVVAREDAGAWRPASWRIRGATRTRLST